LRTPFVAVLRTVMAAPATTAPEESFTSPVTVPSVCANSGADKRLIAMSAECSDWRMFDDMETSPQLP